MASDTFYLAEFNIARLKAPLDSPLVKEFADFLAPVNQFAEQSPGFVWRLTAPDGAASSYLPPVYDDALIVTNLSVWEDAASLKNFVYNTVHAYFLRSRKKWLEPLTDHQVVLWWVRPNVMPTLEDSMQKLAFLNQNGPTPAAFTLRQMFDASGFAMTDS